MAQLIVKSLGERIKEYVIQLVIQAHISSNVVPKIIIPYMDCNKIYVLR